MKFKNFQFENSYFQYSQILELFFECDVLNNATCVKPENFQRYNCTICKVDKMYNLKGDNNSINCIFQFCWN